MGKYQVDQQVSPEIAQDSEATLTAMKELERGWPRAMEKIAERASLTKGPDTRRNPPRGVYSSIFPAAQALRCPLSGVKQT